MKDLLADQKLLEWKDDFEASDHFPGYRLNRLEVLNWGTFDGAVHALHLDGQTTLLVGQNGSGKSTLVDALLTLLVRAGKTRNYNLAAGASKTERSEKSYILGAYDRRSQEDDNRGEVRYLRQGAKAPTVLLAHFHNQASQHSFTLAQILYLSDGDVQKVYCFSSDERWIAKDFDGLIGVEKLAQVMRERGFKTSTSYQDYFQWFRKVTGVKERAMDMFNQTVAVKDIQCLNDFIRKHMLEVEPWGKKVEDLFQHFKDLSDAHQELERVRRQRDDLQPIEKYGETYLLHANRADRCDRLLSAAESYFPQKVIELYEPEIAQKENELVAIRARIEQLKGEISSANEECHRLKSEIEQAGGERLRQIPLLIESHLAQSANKRKASERYHGLLQEASIKLPVLNSTAFDELRISLGPQEEKLRRTISSYEERRIALVEARVEPVKSAREIAEELELLMRRQGNLPREHVEVRRKLCEELRIAERDLPFAAELVAVNAESRDWESSIETVLRGFALSLLVPQRHYLLVSRYLDKTALRDARGHGQKLVYFQVTDRERMVSGPPPDERSLFRKLEFRDGWSPLLPWVKAELRERYNIRCCETVEEFQQSYERALTKNRHFKQSTTRHERDDRDRVADLRFFVLGWDNQEKKRQLSKLLDRLRNEIAQFDVQIDELGVATNACRRELDAVERIGQFSSFAEIDFAFHAETVADLQREMQELEHGNDKLRALKQRLDVHEKRIAGLEEDRYQGVRQENSLETAIKEARKWVDYNRLLLQSLNLAKDSVQALSQLHADLDLLLSNPPLSLDNFQQRRDEFTKQKTDEQKTLAAKLSDLSSDVVRAMNKFLASHPEKRADLDVETKYLPDYLALLQRIRAEDLPRFEDRFKDRLNEKVGQEIGILRGSLNKERSNIEERIGSINESLRQVQYGIGTHMKLIAKSVRDREISDFRQELDACVSGQFEGTLVADEARYKRIESLIVKLRDELNWRNRVTDVRNWFDFAAVETDDVTGEEQGYYDDSAGQSGGEKAKLAFTILIAAIAYQYGIDAHHSKPDRFQFVVVDEMFSRVDDANSHYALELFRRFGLQLLIVAPLDAKARVTEGYVGSYLHVSKSEKTNRSQVLQMTAREFEEHAAEVTSEMRHRSPR